MSNSPARTVYTSAPGASPTKENSGVEEATREKLAEAEKEKGEEQWATAENGGASSTKRISSSTRERLAEAERLLEERSRSRTDRETTTATRARLAEVEKLLEAERTKTASKTTTRTRNLLEEKIKELERLKEAGSGTTTTTRTREMLSKVKREVAEEKAKLTTSKTLAELERQEAMLRKLKEQERDTDVAFLLDCTGSMWSHIEAAKNNIKQVVDEIMGRYAKCVKTIIYFLAT